MVLSYSMGPGIYGSKPTPVRRHSLKDLRCHKSLATHAVSIHLIGPQGGARWSSIETVTVNKST